jgi:7,8-dihydropterin-6-yl-methyl-4-(beta-D-ribofuranosyl)aminobenzene 5'-phosphate synthase
MKLTILYDNTRHLNNLKEDWGFSCLIEINNGPVILFDTGADGFILKSNMDKLNVNPEIINIIFISHNHYDHTGGLSHILHYTADTEIYIPASFKGLKNRGKIITTGKDIFKIRENIYSTGELAGIEQSLILDTEKGIILITGCAHPGLNNIINTAGQMGNIYAVLGGFHDFRDLEALSKAKMICPFHCTQKIKEIKNTYPEKFMSGGVGKIVEI